MRKVVIGLVFLMVVVISNYISFKSGETIGFRYGIEPVLGSAKELKQCSLHNDMACMDLHSDQIAGVMRVAAESYASEGYFVNGWFKKKTTEYVEWHHGMQQETPNQTSVVDAKDAQHN